jgi:GTP-binding protein HflX
VITPELARHLTTLSRELGRQIGVLLSREGQVRSVIVGDANHLLIPDIGRLRGGTGRFRGLRLVHTHLRGESLTRDDLGDLALLRLDLVAVVQALEGGEPGSVEIAHILPGADGAADEADPYRKVHAGDLHRLAFDCESEIRALEVEFGKIGGSRPDGDSVERALVLGLTPNEEHLKETADLVRAAGVEVAHTMPQRRAKIHPRTVVGKGRLRDIVLEGMRRRAEVAIFNIDLKPAQARAFEDATGLKAVDRTQLILDIFAQRAKSGAGKLQVELAQLKYSLPRLTEEDAGLSRLYGGIGGRGPGETVLEVGRRRIRNRIRTLEKRIERLSKQRAVRRQRRTRAQLPVLSIIGYTNAGKSTLLNALTESRVDSADQMFVTLDPTSRRLRFPRQGDVIVTDTVGFIRDLPPDLLEAFRATLEELLEADLLIHVLDASDPHMDRKKAAVESLLMDLQLHQIPRLAVLNKSDLMERPALEAMVRRYECQPVSARHRTGLDGVVAAAEKILRKTL